VDAAPDFDWSPVAGATAYRIQVDDDDDFSSPELDVTTPTPGYTPDPPLPLGSYGWRVQALNACGTGAWSTSWRLRILAGIYLPVVQRDLSQ
jgi:hypothetical protein